MWRRSRAGLVVVLALVVAACGSSGDTGPDTATASGTAEPTVTTEGAQSTTTTTIDGADVDDEEPVAAEEPAVTEPPSVERWPSDLAALDPAEPARWTIEVLDTAPHDPSAFTQGLEELDDGRLLESTGIRGVSDLRIVDPVSGVVENAARLAPDEFGEGVTVVGDTAVQLTWQEQVARRWSLPTLEPLDPFTYEGEGWGLCLLGERLAMTDGSSTITWRDPDTFAVLETVMVHLADDPVPSLNELECVDGHVMANVFGTSFIVVIRPDGAVVAVIDASTLTDTIASADPDREVLNGIAALADGTFTLTGKLWPTRFVVAIVTP